MRCIAHAKCTICRKKKLLRFYSSTSVFVCNKTSKCTHLYSFMQQQLQAVSQSTHYTIHTFMLCINCCRVDDKHNSTIVENTCTHFSYYYFEYTIRLFQLFPDKHDFLTQQPLLTTAAQNLNVSDVMPNSSIDDMPLSISVLAY
uniref:Uncharacterized protein n=1 Tax=Bactrocera latifrons TaxID=174628 RepID=A0A0K8TZ02_BACLA